MRWSSANPQTPQPQPNPCAGQIAALQKANDAAKTATDSAAAKNYLWKIGVTTSGAALAGAIAGAPVLGVGAVVGGIGFGIGGLANSTVWGGITLRSQYAQATKDWTSNYKLIQNFSNLGCNGDAPEIRYSEIPLHNPLDH